MNNNHYYYCKLADSGCHKRFIESSTPNCTWMICREIQLIIIDKQTNRINYFWCFAIVKHHAHISYVLTFIQIHRIGTRVASFADKRIADLSSVSISNSFWIIWFSFLFICLEFRKVSTWAKLMCTCLITLLTIDIQFGIIHNIHKVYGIMYIQTISQLNIMLINPKI